MYSEYQAQCLKVFPWEEPTTSVSPSMTLGTPTKVSPASGDVTHASAPATHIGRHMKVAARKAAILLSVQDLLGFPVLKMQALSLFLTVRAIFANTVCQMQRLP